MPKNPADRGRGRGRGRGGPGGGPGCGGRPELDDDIPGYGFIKKAVSTQVFTFQGQQASRFARTLDSCPSMQKPDLLQLLHSGDFGTIRLRDAVMTCSTASSVGTVEEVVVKILSFLCDPEFRKPLLRIASSKLIRTVFNVPFFMELVAAHLGALSHEAASTVCRFFIEVCRRQYEPRASLQLKAISDQLISIRGAGDAESMTLRNILFDLEGGNQVPNVPDNVASVIGVVEKRLPSGRHSNDFRDYRRITIEPTMDEILCEEQPYLPLGDANRFIESDKELMHTLDRNFRLLREDFLRPLRERLDENCKILSGLSLLGIEIGYGPGVPSLVFELKALPKQTAQFMARHRGKPSSTSTAKKKTKEIPGLEGGSLVCLVLRDEPIWCGQVVAGASGEEWLGRPGKPRIGVVLNAAEEHSMYKLEGLLKHTGSATTFDLIGISSSFFSYAPVLRRLQEIESLPLSDELLFGRSSQMIPEVFQDPARVSLQIPGNSQAPVVDLSSESAIDTVTASTSLDLYQAQALLRSLKSRVAILQGPPGTGKSFIGAAIAKTIRLNAPDAKIAVFCYTNHALDDFLKDLIEADHPESTVRIGGRSKLPEIAKHNIFELARRLGGGRDFNRCYATLKGEQEMLTGKADRLRDRVKNFKLAWGDEIKEVLEDHSQQSKVVLQAVSLKSELSQGEFNLVGPSGNALTEKDIWASWVSGKRQAPRGTKSQATRTGTCAWNIPPEERKALCLLWRNELLSDTFAELASAYREMLAVSKNLSNLRQDGQRLVMNSARIVGATTTGAAKYSDLMQSYDADVVIIEEAAEILEAHTLSSIFQAKQLVLIGDHKQLRPKVDAFALTVASGNGYRLDMSLFERLVTEMKFPYSQLRSQHRMRPEISDLIRLDTYPNLIDHDATRELADVKGVDLNLLFIDHDRPDSGNTFQQQKSAILDTSKSNEYEAGMAVALCRYLLQQGQFKPHDIVILTPYLGQVQLLALKMHAELTDVTAVLSEQDKLEMEDSSIGSSPGEETAASSTGVRVSSVDNFQGEEGKVVIVSLVRSNAKGSLGFLDQQQRVNVLLSRARNGMYIFGSKRTLTQKPKGEATWGRILDKLNEENRVVPGVPVRCQAHPENAAVMREPSNFNESRPNGGCELLCQSRMSCGHSCDLSCHGTYDPEHKLLQCPKDCDRFPEGCFREHKCPKRCHEVCGPCQEMVLISLPDCFHQKMVPCCVADSSVKLSKEKCGEEVNFLLSCGHSIQVICSSSQDPKKARLFECKVVCKTSLTTCSHECNRKCHRASGPCGPCTNPCSVELRCGHVGCSLGVCHESDAKKLCESCIHPCAISCEHSRCSKQCSDVCAPCLEPCLCIEDCSHQPEEEPCNSLCGAPCTRLPCAKKCEKELDCECPTGSSRCPSLCGESCPPPDWCQRCGTKGQEVVDMIMLTTYEEIDLGKDSIILLECGHAFLTSTLDELFELESFYFKNDGHWGDAKVFGTNHSGMEVKVKKCPSCRSILRGINRYGRVSKLSDLHVLEDRFALDCSSRLMAAKALRSGGDAEEALKRLLNISRRYKSKNPKRVVYEASTKLGSFAKNDMRGASKVFTQPLIDVTKELLLAAEDVLHLINDPDDNDPNDKDRVFKKAEKHARTGMLICDEQKFFVGGDFIRCQFVTCLLARYPTDRPTVPFAEAKKLLLSVVSPSNRKASKEFLLVATLLNKKIENAGLSEQEKMGIEKAMSLDPENISGGQHWYACPNGHRFYIGNCGQAMQTAVCNECGSGIGGGSGSLRSSNVASSI